MAHLERAHRHDLLVPQAVDADRPQPDEGDDRRLPDGAERGRRTVLGADQQGHGEPDEQRDRVAAAQRAEHRDACRRVLRHGRVPRSPVVGVRPDWSDREIVSGSAPSATPCSIVIRLFRLFRRGPTAGPLPPWLSAEPLLQFRSLRRRVAYHDAGRLGIGISPVLAGPRQIVRRADTVRGLAPRRRFRDRFLRPVGAGRPRRLARAADGQSGARQPVLPPRLRRRGARHRPATSSWLSRAASGASPRPAAAGEGARGVARPVGWPGVDFQAPIAAPGTALTPTDLLVPTVCASWRSTTCSPTRPAVSTGGSGPSRHRRSST